MNKVLIVGASRGIGLEFAVQYAAEGGPGNGAIADNAARQRRAREVLGVMLGSTYFMYR